MRSVILTCDNCKKETASSIIRDDSEEHWSLGWITVTKDVESRYCDGCVEEREFHLCPECGEKLFEALYKLFEEN